VDFILDTDHVTIIQLQKGLEFTRFQAHLQAHAGALVGTTIISFQEQVQGWLAYIKSARTGERILRGYASISTLLSDYCRATVLTFNQSAQDRFNELQRFRLRIGTMDLRIASITLVTGATLLTRNQRDFRKVPGLRIDDWTR
jgi:tRNA(fMet)-specific endonuclease VapC